jgi:hypothetical protein
MLRDCALECIKALRGAWLRTYGPFQSAIGTGMETRGVARGSAALSNSHRRGRLIMVRLRITDLRFERATASLRQCVRTDSLLFPSVCFCGEKVCLRRSGIFCVTLVVVVAVVVFQLRCLCGVG